MPLVLIGAAPGVAEACAERLRREQQGIQVPFVHHGYVSEPTARELRQRIAELGRCMVLVGMGTPMQEAWAWRHLRNLPGVTVLTVGALFDFYSGRIPRAPLHWRTWGLEWAWRFRQEPRRMAGRYLLGIPVFLARTALQRLYEHPEDYVGEEEQPIALRRRSQRAAFMRDVERSGRGRRRASRMRPLRARWSEMPPGE
jgi:N-acetylglucosaminyldiphosphoundecaprenol N-acetyl-beta-D-mannosaminyltransferase